MRKAIGIDFGGTKTIIAVVDERGKVLASMRYKTPKERSEVIAKLVSGIKKFLAKHNVQAIGVAVAGFFDTEKGVMIKSPNIPSINGLNFRKELEKHFSLPIVFENDANAYAIACYALELKHKYKNMCCFTLGTGIGSGIISNGVLFKGAGFASEFGHIIIDINSQAKCGCGNYGCFEALANGYAFKRIAREKGLNVKDAKELAKLAERNKKAREVIKECARAIAVGMVNASNAFDIEAIVLGGGLSNIKLLTYYAKKYYKGMHKIREVRIFVSKLENAAAIGAALLALHEIETKLPRVAVDIIIEYYRGNKFEGIILIKRKYEPKGWALPGGALSYNETLEQAAMREAKEETGLKIKELKQFKAYSDPKRDKRWHTVSVVFTAKASGRIVKNHETSAIRVFPLNKIPKKLCFDHAKIIRDWLRFREQN